MSSAADDAIHYLESLVLHTTTIVVVVVQEYFAKLTDGDLILVEDYLFNKGWILNILHHMYYLTRKQP